MTSLEGRVCAVTGASSGIGRALTIALARSGAQVVAVARSEERLGSLVGEAGGPGTVFPLVADLADDQGLESAAAGILVRDNRLDVLVHCAGTIQLEGLASATASELDRQYAVNLRAPVALTRALLPALERARGQVVFVNSSAALKASADNVLYAVTKAGLKAFADGLRETVNRDGIRVLTVYVGRTATPMQAHVHESEGRPYRADLLLQPEDVAESVVAALVLPSTGEVTELSIRPMSKLPEAPS
jgi:NADP-dependent 3-hydroxy acid dehydrogenase YdfG